MFWNFKDLTKPLQQSVYWEALARVPHFMAKSKTPPSAPSSGCPHDPTDPSLLPRLQRKRAFFAPTQTKPRQKGNRSLQFCSPLLFFLSWSSHSNVLKCVTVTLYKAFKESTSTCRLFQNEIINKRKNKSGPSLKAKKTPKITEYLPLFIYSFKT